MTRFVPAPNVVAAMHATLLRVVTTATNLSFGIAAARLVGDEQFGTYISIFAVATLLSVISAAGFPGLLQREISLARGSREFGMLYPLIQLLMVLNLICVGALLFATFVAPGQVQLLLIVILGNNFVGLTAAVFRGYEQVLTATWLGDVARPLGALLCLFPVVVVFEPTANSLLVAQISGSFFAFTLLLVFWRKPVWVHLRGAISSSLWSEQHKKIVQAGALFSGSQFLINLKTQSEIFLLTLIADPQDVALFYAASRAALVVAFFSTAAYLMSEPRLTRLLGAGNSHSVKAEVRSTRTIGFVGSAAVGALAIFFTPFYLTLYGDSFLFAAPVMYVLIISVVVRTLFGPALPVLRAARKDSAVLTASFYSLCIGLPISAGLTFQFGIIGAAVGSFIHSTVNEWWLARSVQLQTGYSTHLFSR